MEHTNKIAIQILKDQYSDYPENAWHYDEQYKMIVKGIELSKEVPVAGVTDEINTIWESGKSTVNKNLLDKIKDEVTMTLTGHKWEDTPDRFKDIYVNIAMNRYLDAITGNKPLKTEEEINPYEIAFRNFIRENHLTRKWELYLEDNDIEFIDKNKIVEPTLDKEALLKQAKDNVAKNHGPQYGVNSWDLMLYKHYCQEIPDRFFDMYINMVFEEYLRLCTGGGEKE